MGSRKEINDKRAELTREIARLNGLNAQAASSKTLSFGVKSSVNTIVKSVFDKGIDIDRATRNLNNIIKSHK
tara:strand:+ start:1418 stop:1633 length:216 start_codon:yes stop_codon:yes gene_type:complete